VRVSKEWLSEFIELRETGAELAELFTAAGVEVAGVETAAAEECGGPGDEILDLELYPNRPDCLCMAGIAREAGALLGRRPALSGWANGEEKIWPASRQRVVVDAPELCLRYAGLVTENAAIAPSPAWMRNRLSKAGVRPINNVVDITNYCMLELGQPLHAFDADKVRGDIHVRLARQGETIITLDGITRALAPDMLVIADDSGPVAIAGVMGGLATEITPATKNIFFESAHFLGASVRRASRRLGLRSESSGRFEKGVDPHLCLAALGRVAELMSELAAGRPAALTEYKGELPPPRRVTLTEGRLALVTGARYAKTEIARVLRDLDFAYTEAEGIFTVEIPFYRQDLHIEEDLIEEIARIIGYDRIPTTLPQGETTVGRRSPRQDFRLLVRDTLTRSGFCEAITYSFVNPQQDALWGGKRRIALRNPLRDELSVMRTSILPGLLEAGARNAARRNTDWLLFEMGSVYLTEEDDLREPPLEAPRLAGVLLGESGRHWREAPGAYDFFYGKGVLEALARACRVVFHYERLTEARYADLLHPGRAALVRVEGERLGVLGELHPNQNTWGGARPVVFELDLDALYRHASRKITAAGYPRFPGMSRDLAVVVAEEVAAADILRRIRELGGDLLREAGVFDLYRGAPVPPGRKSLAFHLYYQSPERTLTEEEAGAMTAEILMEVEREFGAARRQ
jgi:phenylalanyl-tRNA synthetase beta chain